MRTKNSTSQQAQEIVDQPISDVVAEEQEATGVENTDASGSSEESEEAVQSTEEAESADSAEPATPTRKKRVRRKITPEEEEKLSPKRSIWPLALALALIVLFMGVILHPIVLVVGIIMLVGSVIGWIVERR